MKTLAIAAAAILAATLVAGAMVPEAAFAAEGSTWRTRPPVRGLKCDEVQYPNGPAKVLAGLEGRCASEIYFLAPRKDCASRRAQFPPPQPGLKPPRPLKPGELFKHLECLQLRSELAGKKPVEGPVVSERR